MKPFIRILRLEDDPKDAELVQAKLEGAGLNCGLTVIQTRDEFEETLRQDGYDVILADLWLPTYDGMSAPGVVMDMAGNSRSSITPVKRRSET